MPHTQISTDAQSRRNFRCPSIPFYLKAILLTCASTAAYAILRGGYLGGWLLSGAGTGSDAQGGNTLADPFSIKLDGVSVTTEPTHFLANTADSITPIQASSSLIHFEEHPLILNEAENVENPVASSPLSLHYPKRRLLQNTELGNQIIPIGEEYTRDVSGIFPGDYTFVGATETGKNSLPSWLSLQYKPAGISKKFSDRDDMRRIMSSGNIMFVASGRAGLQIADISDPSNPRLLGNYSTVGSEWIVDVAVSGHIAFVANDEVGLQVLDVSNLKNPKFLSDYKILGDYKINGSLSNKVAVFGNTAFVGFTYSGYAGLHILDVSNLTQPQFLGNYTVGRDSVNGIVVSGNTVFMAYGSLGLHIVNVTNSTNPKLLGNYTVGGGYADGIAVSGDTVFIAYNSLGLHIVNVSNPIDPKLLGNYTISNNYVDGVILSGNTVFLASPYSGTLYMVDVSNLSNPRLLGYYLAEGGTISDILISEHNWLLASRNKGLQIVDPKQATLTGIPSVDDVKVGQTLSITVVANDMHTELANNTFTLTLNNPPTLVQTILTDQSIFPGQSFILPINSEELFKNPSTSFLRLSIAGIKNNSFSDSEWLTLKAVPVRQKIYPVCSRHVNDAVVSENKLFAVCDYMDLRIIDITNPINPQSLGNYKTSDNNTYANGVAVSENTAFLTYGSSDNRLRLHIVNITNPFNPQLLGNYTANNPETNAGVYSVAVSDNIVFVAYGRAGLQMIDVSNLTSPQLLGNYTLNEEDIEAYKVAVFKNTAFVAYSSSVQILDISSRTSPQLLFPYLNDSFVQDVVISENSNLAFVTVSDSAGWRLKVVDVSNRINPQLLGRYLTTTGGFAPRKIAISNNIIFMISGEAGIEIIDVSNPRNPSFLGSYSTGSGYSRGYSSKFLPFGKTAFVLEGSNFHIVDLRTWKLTAKPTIDNAGNYPLRLTATDIIGSSVSKDFTIRVEGPPRLYSRVPVQHAEIGRPFSFNIPSDTFTHPNSDPLKFDLKRADGSDWPGWLQFNAISVTLSGVPSDHDRGIMSLRLTAEDPRGQKAFNYFDLRVVKSPQAILGQPVFWVQNRFRNHTILLEGIFDGYDQPLIYDIKADAAGNMPLPEWLNSTMVDKNSLRLSGIPTLTGPISLRVFAQTSLNYTTSTPFVLSISANFPPQLKQVISVQSATVGTGYNLPLDEKFKDDNGDRLTYTVSLVGGASLPNWLKLVQDKMGWWHLTGTPGGWDTDVFSDRTMTIQIIAQDDQGASGTTSFNLSVTGTSTLGLLVKFAAPALSVFGLFQKRASILNRLCYKRYQKSPHTLEAGQSFNVPLSTPKKSVGNIEIKRRHIPPKNCARFTDCQRFFKPPIHYLQLPYDPLPGGASLPEWMKYKEENNTLEGIVPPNINYRELIVRIKDFNGIVQEQFALKLEGVTLDQEENESFVLVRSKPNPKNTQKVDNSVDLDDLEGGGGHYSRLQG